MPKPFPKEFREDVVRVARKRDPKTTLEEVAKDFGIHATTLTSWLKKADVEEGVKPGMTEDQASELRELKRRNRLLEQENEVLRRPARGSGKIAGKSSPRPGTREVLHDRSADRRRVRGSVSRAGNQRLQGLSLRTPPVTIINKTCVSRHQIVFQVGHFPVKGDRLHSPVGFQQNGTTRRLVTTPGLHTNVAVLDNIGTPNTVLPALPIQFSK